MTTRADRAAVRDTAKRTASEVLPARTTRRPAAPRASSVGGAPTGPAQAVSAANEGGPGPQEQREGERDPDGDEVMGRDQPEDAAAAAHELLAAQAQELAALRQLSRPSHRRRRPARRTR